MPRLIPKFLFSQFLQTRLTTTAGPRLAAAIGPLARIQLVLGLACLTSFAGAAHAQSSCSSDKQPRASALVERFLMADCADCWAALPAGTVASQASGHISDQRVAKASGQVSARVAGQASGKPTAPVIRLDWIAPTSNDEAPLSAAAVRDSLTRLGKATLPAGQSLERRKAITPALAKPASALPRVRLRVAHGLGFNGYIGTSIGLYSTGSGAATLKKWPQGLTAHIALVETLPAGAEGSQIPRNLVRNYQMSALNGQTMLYKKEREGEQIFFDSRPLSVPEGAKAERLAVVGWLEDAQGNVLQAVASKCTSAL